MKSFLLLPAVEESMFGIPEGNLSQMVTELADVGISVMAVAGNTSMSIFAHTTDLSLLEALCTDYNLQGTVVEFDGVYNQSVTEEVIIR